MGHDQRSTFMPSTATAHRPLLMALVTLLVLGASCAREQPIEKTRLARLPADYRNGTIVVSTDGWAYAVVVSGPDGDRVLSSNGTDPVHAQALAITFTPKSHRFVYWVNDEPKDAERRYRLVSDGSVMPIDSSLPGQVVFSDDGSRWVVVALQPGASVGEAGTIVLLENGREIGRYPDASVPALSQDAQHVAQLGAKDHRTTLYVDGIARQTFDPPSAPCAEAAARSAPSLDLPLRHSVSYLADGSLLVVTRDPDGWGIYVDGSRIASYPLSTFDVASDECRRSATLAVRSIRSAKSAPATFWWERISGDAELWRVVRNGQPIDDQICIEPWPRQPPEISADGQHVAYPCATSNAAGQREVFLVQDRNRYGPYQDVWGVALSANGEHAAYGAADRSERRPWAVYADGQARARDFESVWRPRISDDGATVAWEARRDQEGRGILGINARRIGGFDDVLWGPELEPGDRVAWVIRRGRQLTRLSVPITLGQPPRRSARIVVKATPSPSPFLAIQTAEPP